jgi:hypothetical protein
MIEFEWNQLVDGDRVVIHAHGEKGYANRALGTVVSVTQNAGHNDVGVRPDGDDDAAALWPTRLEVHALNDAATSVCPWCASIGRPVAAVKVPRMTDRARVGADGRG